MMLITSMRLFLLKRKEASLAIQFTFPTRVRFDCVGVRMGFSTVSEHFPCIKSTFEKRIEIDKIFILSVSTLHMSVSLQCTLGHFVTDGSLILSS